MTLLFLVFLQKYRYAFMLKKCFLTVCCKKLQYIYRCIFWKFGNAIFNCFSVSTMFNKIINTTVTLIKKLKVVASSVWSPCIHIQILSYSEIACNRLIHKKTIAVNIQLIQKKIHIDGINLSYDLHCKLLWFMLFSIGTCHAIDHLGVLADLF